MFFLVRGVLPHILGVILPPQHGPNARLECLISRHFEHALEEMAVCQRKA